MKKHNKPTQKIQKVTIYFGYTLFAVLVLNLIFSTILPFSSYFLNPGARHFNIAVFLISLVTGAILPPLLAYIAGDRATRSKSKSVHHFNGVLFGVAAYWLSLFFSFIGSEVISDIRRVVAEPLATVIANWPIVATLAIMLTLAVCYAKNSKHQPALLEYKPYQLVLFAGMIATFAYVLLNQNYTEGNLWVVSVLYVVVPLLLVGVSYKILPAGGYVSSRARLAGAVVAVSIGFIASTSIGQLLGYSIASTLLSSISAGIIALGLYLFFVRFSRS